MMFAYIPILLSDRASKTAARRTIKAKPDSRLLIGLGAAFIVLATLELFGEPARLRIVAATGLDELVLAVLIGSMILVAVGWSLVSAAPTKTPEPRPVTPLPTPKLAEPERGEPEPAIRSRTSTTPVKAQQKSHRVRPR